MIQGKTKSGFEFYVRENIGRDYRFVKSLSEVMDGKLNSTPLVFEKVLGPDQTEKLTQHIEEKVGWADVEEMTAELIEILQSSIETKN